jgi:hypothetical protein
MLIRHVAVGHIPGTSSRNLPQLIRTIEIRIGPPADGASRGAGEILCCLDVEVQESRTAVQQKYTATPPTNMDLMRPAQASDLHQRPASTSLQLVHTEVVICSAERASDSSWRPVRIEALALAMRAVTVTGLRHVPVSIAIGSAAGRPALPKVTQRISTSWTEL